MNYEIEEQFIANLLLKPDAMKRVSIPDVCFLDLTNKFIFNLLKRQFQDSNTISIVGLAENYKYLFNERYKINDIIRKLTNIMNDTLIVDKIDYYQETLFSRYIEHEILKAIQDFQKQKISSNELLQNIHKFELMGIKTDDNRLSKSEIFALINSKNKNIQFRFEKLSNAANIQEHDLVIIAARTGIGKSGFCLNLMEELSNTYNCIYFNMEMSVKQVYQRLVAINTGIPMRYHDNPETSHQLNSIKTGCENISKKKIKIFNQVPTVSNIRHKISMESKNEHTIVFIDHVGLIRSIEKGTSYEKITSIVKELRQISLDYDCTIFLVSQLSRDSSNKSTRSKDSKLTRPTISCLRDSGELEQSATTVLLLHDEDHENNKSKKEIDMEIIIGKNRNGQLGIAKLNYNRENQRYDEIKTQIKDPNDWRKE